MVAYVHPAERELKGEAEKSARLTRMLEIEDEVFQTAAAIVQATLDFCHVTPDQTEPPPDWVARYGHDAALKRLAVAKAGWMPRSLSPAGAQLAPQVVLGISRARRQTAQLTGPREINAKIALPAPTSAGMPGAPEYPSKEVE